MTPIAGRFYNWKGQPERLVYMGTLKYHGDSRTWHQFAKVDTPQICWSEVLESDLAQFEETPPVCPGIEGFVTGGHLDKVVARGKVVLTGRMTGVAHQQVLDTQRMDWFAEHGGRLVDRIGGTWYWRAGPGWPLHKATSLRDAIDKARSS